MKKLDKKFVIISIAVALLIVSIITVSSYAYFTISNKEGEETVIKSGTMTLKLTDGNTITANDMLPGQSIEKEFSVKNTGTVSTKYDVYLSEVINTFADRTDLVYEIESLDGGYNTTSQVEVPNITKKIVSEQNIGVNDTHHYKLKITFLNKDENQDDNQGKEFKATIQVNEYKDIETTVNYYLDNVLVDNIPNNTKRYVNGTCDKNATISFDTDNWEYELININQNHTTCNLYFETVRYDLTYNYNYEGSTNTSTNLESGSQYGTLPNPERTGYDFLGWYTEPTGGSVVSSSDIIASDTTIYAHWLLIQLESISVQTNPTKMTYKQGDTLDLSGLVVVATYTNNTSNTISSGLSYSPNNNSTLNTVGTIPVTISYTDNGVTKTCSFNIVVNEKYIDNRVNITINKNTSKGGTITENNGEYTITGQALLETTETMNMNQMTIYMEVKNLTKYYTSSTYGRYSTGLVFGTGTSGGDIEQHATGVAVSYDDVVCYFAGVRGGAGNIYNNVTELGTGWNRIAFTFNGSKTQVIVNGEVKGTYNGGEIERTKLYIGGWSDAPRKASGVEWSFMNGSYRNIKVYNAALSASDL